MLCNINNSIDMKNYILMLSAAVIFMISGCTSSETNNEASKKAIIQEEKIATEVEESSEEIKKEAEDAEKEVDKLLEEI